jgi:translation initiation factor 3 subunit C
MNLLEENPNIIVQDDSNELESDVDNEKKLLAGENVILRGNVAAFVDRLDQEFIKSLLAIEPNSLDYSDRLKSEIQVYAMLIRALNYFEAMHNKNAIATITMCRLEHIYFRPLEAVKEFEKTVAHAHPNLASYMQSQNAVLDVCYKIYDLGHERLFVKATLCHVYHLALHDQYALSRDLILLSHIQETISTLEIPLQILYNRTIAQFSLCAFRTGNYKDVVSAIHDLFANNRPRELLGQSKPYAIPHHMHINLDFLESVFYVSSMFGEVSNMALHPYLPLYDAKKQVVSKPFKRLMEYSERALFVGPPENFKERIVFATKAIMRGAWKDAVDAISGIPIWNTVNTTTTTTTTTPLIGNNILEMIIKQIKLESLRCFILTSRIYTHIHIPRFSTRFSLSPQDVQTLFSSMLYESQIYGVLDMQKQVIELDWEYANQIDYIANSFVEKEVVLKEYSEKMNDVVKKLRSKRK